MKRFFIFVLLFSIAITASAQNEITLLAPGPMRTPLDKIVANFQAKGTYKVKVTYGTGLSTRQSIAKGERFRKIVSGVDVARSRVEVSIRRAPHPSRVF